MGMRLFTLSMPLIALFAIFGRHLHPYGEGSAPTLPPSTLEITRALLESKERIRKETRWQEKESRCRVVQR